MSLSDTSCAATGKLFTAFAPDSLLAFSKAPRLHKLLRLLCRERHDRKLPSEQETKLPLPELELEDPIESVFALLSAEPGVA